MTDPIQGNVIPPLGRRSDAAIIAPDGSEVRLLLTADHAASRCSMVEVDIPAGSVSRPVWHRTVEEVWYVTEGAGEVWRCPPGGLAGEAEPMAVAQGDCLAIPTGWLFQFRAADTTGLRFLCVTMPPWPGMDEAVEESGGGYWPATL